MKRHAFTLVELLVVIAIIGLLSSIAVVSLSSARAKSRDIKRLADKNVIIKALQLYYEDNGGWPATSVSHGWNCFGAGTGETCWSGAYAGFDSLVDAMSSYMASFPKSGTDPGTTAYNRYLYSQSWGWGGNMGAVLIWYKENPIASSECFSLYPIQHYDKYWYCYEYLGL